MLYKRYLKIILPTSKSDMVLWKKKKENYLKKQQNYLEKLHPDYWEEREKRLWGHVCVFCQDLVYNSENYSNFKNVSLKIWSIVEINDYNRTRGNVSFTELS